MTSSQSTTSAQERSKYYLDVNQVRKWLPHRYPFMLVDRILEIHPVGDLSDLRPGTSKAGVRVVGTKNISFNEPIFQGHFPGFSIYPGVLIIETMAQVGSFSMYPYLAHDLENLTKDLQTILVGVDAVRFRKPVIPGDTLRIETVVSKCRGKLWVFEAKAYVDGDIVAEAELMANLVLNPEASK